MVIPVTLTNGEEYINTRAKYQCTIYKAKVMIYFQDSCVFHIYLNYMHSYTLIMNIIHAQNSITSRILHKMRHKRSLCLKEFMM